MNFSNFDNLLTAMLIGQMKLIGDAQAETAKDASEINELFSGLYNAVLAIGQLKEAGVSCLSKETIDLYLTQANLMFGEQGLRGE